MVVVETSPSAVKSANGTPEIEQLQVQIRELEKKCAGLIQVLAKAESEGDAYRHLFLDEARQRREFEDADLPALQATSAGSIEKL